MELLHADAHLVAVNKPGGTPAQADPTGDPSLLDALRAAYGHGVELPHRLDRPVSGVLVAARTPEALRALNTAFASGRVRKVYWAIVEGLLHGHGTWQTVLTHDARARRARTVAPGEGRAVRLAWRVLRAGERYTLLELRPEQGAFHQLRAQCAAAGHPIKGDVKYGARRGEKDRTIALHARSIALLHPVTGADLLLEAPSPDGALWRALVPVQG
jgi:23S rRNA pseudouridine1911/1915/1917 synthase